MQNINYPNHSGFLGPAHLTDILRLFCSSVDVLARQSLNLVFKTSCHYALRADTIIERLELMMASPNLAQIY